jgi:hypothetical protein
MNRQPDTTSDRGQDLSDLADGRASPAQARALCEAWANDAGLRRDWQVLHLLGDTLRSAELATQAQRAEVLLAALRERLRTNLAPAPAHRPLGRWLAPLAVAAGFVGVALVVPGLQMKLSPARAPEMAQRSVPRLEPTLSTGLLLDQGEPSFAQSLVAPPHPVLLQMQALPYVGPEPTSGAPAR